MHTQRRWAFHLWGGILDSLDNGDCVEDFDEMPLVQFQIDTITQLVRRYYKEAEWCLNNPKTTPAEWIMNNWDSDDKEYHISPNSHPALSKEDEA